MSNSVVSIAINARNLAGGAFNQLRSQVGSVTNALGAMRSQFTQSTQETGKAVNAVSLLSGQYFLLNKAAEAATFAFSKLSSAGSDAIQRQVEQVSALSTAMQTLGLSQRDAGRYTQGVETAIAKLGKDLPVNAENIQVFFKTIQDDYNIALKGAGASLDTIKKAQLSSSSRIALLSDLAGGDVGASRSAVSAFLGGSVGAQGLNQYQFFANNPQLSNALKSGLTARGVKSTGDLSGLERVKLLTEALEKAVTPQMIDLLQGTVKARLSAFTDALFDPTIGLFSIQRDLEPKIDGYQSVFTAFGDTLDILIGSNGIVENLTRLLGFSGTDPMQSLYDGVNALNAYLLGVAGGLAKLKSLSGTDIGASVGKFLAQATNLVFDGLLGAIASIKWGGLIKGVFVGIGAFFANLDWKVYLAGALALAATAIAPFIIGAIGTFVAGVVSVVAGALIGVPVLIISAIVVGVVAIAKLISDNWEAISSFVSTTWDKLTKKVASIIDGIASAVSGFFGAIQQKLAGITQAISNPGGIVSSPVVQSTTAGAATGGLFGGLLGFASGLASSFFSRADGFIPASGGFLGALASEAARKPTGSDFVIANSSEAVLTPRMLQNLTGNLLGAGSSKTVNFQPGAIVFNLPSGTPTEIAMAAIAIIEQALATELETKIA
ncbi:MAG: hypothetical protein KME60_03420 [Cyanomargarita calcarea GSE-NOS-MK-12-04C]|jgi:hypothetical protein|uniref:Uncharacterized protein n=1 Tax=Cyanomargarita calcarea GSE-NOS-MK-12-04C TaxID=2839659 RepID=A0A951URQ8_9CYAN|nr:hypothetical protein [Cyanomargarita calcarea GSE-NOS-MK-12-04C]